MRARYALVIILPIACSMLGTQVADARSLPAVAHLERSIVQGQQAHANFGWSVDAAGDVNGDGFGDVIAGAPFYDNAAGDEGSVFVYLGSASGLVTDEPWTGEGDQKGERFGFSVGTAGDVNGDGFDDVIVGSIGYDNAFAEAGRASVFLGSASGLSTTPDWTAEGDQVNENFGLDVGTAGDVNGDGFDDVIVGAPYWAGGPNYEGRAFAFLGSASGLGNTPAWTAEGGGVEGNFGWSLGTAGDVNGDGFDDVIVGDYRYGDDEGEAFVFLGSASGLSTTAVWNATGGARLQYFGLSVGTAGDVNGDGFDDVVVGAPLYTVGQVYEGRASLYSGSVVGPSADADWTAEGDRERAEFGHSVATAGDTNGDGSDELIVGAPFFDHGQTREGRTFVYTDTPLGFGTTPPRTAEGNQANAAFGWAIAGAGDVDGDGFDDLIFGAPAYDHGRVGEGVGFVYYGGSPP